MIYVKNLEEIQNSDAFHFIWKIWFCLILFLPIGLEYTMMFCLFSAI